MPLCIVTTEHTMDPKGANNPDDFVQVQRGEVLKLYPGDNLIAAGFVAVISDSDASEVVACQCGRRFGGPDHPHFTMAGAAHTLFNLRQQYDALEGATAEIRELDLKALKQMIEQSTAPAEQEALALALKIKDAEKRIAAEQKKHKPVEAKAAVAA